MSSSSSKGGPDRVLDFQSFGERPAKGLATSLYIGGKADAKVGQCPRSLWTFDECIHSTRPTNDYHDHITGRKAAAGAGRQVHPQLHPDAQVCTKKPSISWET